MSDLAAALRATSDALLRDLEVLVTLEEEKRAISLDDPRVAELSERIEEIAQRILASSAHQRSLTEDVGGPPLEQRVRPAAAILAEWRDAERQLAESEPGSPAALEAEIRVRQARDEYQRAFDAARGPGGEAGGQVGPGGPGST